MGKKSRIRKKKSSHGGTAARRTQRGDKEEVEKDITQKRKAANAAILRAESAEGNKEFR
jgi:hypothetical protein